MNGRIFKFSRLFIQMCFKNILHYSWHRVFREILKESQMFLFIYCRRLCKRKYFAVVIIKIKLNLLNYYLCKFLSEELGILLRRKICCCQ